MNSYNIYDIIVPECNKISKEGTVVITVTNVSLRYGDKLLFEDVNLKFTPGNCYGVIGANGAGKSTFLKILSGEISPNTGEISISQGTRLSVLKQDHFQYDSFPVLETVIMGNPRLSQIIKEKDALYAKSEFTEEDGVRASELEFEFAELNGWEAESEVATILNGLGIETELHYKTVGNCQVLKRLKFCLLKLFSENLEY